MIRAADTLSMVPKIAVSLLSLAQNHSPFISRPASEHLVAPETAFAIEVRNIAATVLALLTTQRPRVRTTTVHVDFLLRAVVVGSGAVETVTVTAGGRMNQVVNAVAQAAAHEAQAANAVGEVFNGVVSVSAADRAVAVGSRLVEAGCWAIVNDGLEIVSMKINYSRATDIEST